MLHDWGGVRDHDLDRRAWRTLGSMAAVLVIMVAAAVASGEAAWALIGLVGPAALAGDELVRRRQRRRAR